MDRPVLLLNANYAPLNVCNTRRAMGLLMLGKAKIICNGRGVIRTASSAWPRPSVIRLSYMVHRPHPQVKLTKREILRRDNYTCQYCGRQGASMTIDHVTPKKLSGAHDWHNLVTACPACNTRKGGDTPAKARMKLLHQPWEPTATARYIFGRYLEQNQEWDDFIQGW
jgi:5-methylcytosine-specific restriction endonuclease McrA